MQSPSVVVADNNKLTLSGVADSLTAHGVRVVGQGQSAADAFALVEKLRPEALVTDLDFGPGPTGLDVAAKLRKSHPTLGIVILSAYADPRLHQVSLPEVPRGLVYIIKQQVSSTEDLVTAVRVSIENAQRAAKGELPRINLTSSHIAVLRLVAQGLSNSAIAESLTITEESVAKTINRMCKRLGIEGGPDVNVRAALIQTYFDAVGANQ